MLFLTHIPPEPGLLSLCAPDSLQPERRAGTVGEPAQPWACRVPGPGLRASGPVHSVSSSPERRVRSSSRFQGRKVPLRRHRGLPTSQSWRVAGSGLKVWRDLGRDAPPSPRSSCCAPKGLL